MAAEASAGLQVTVAVALENGTVKETTVRLPLGAVLADALHVAGAPDSAFADTGIWGRCRPLDTPLRTGDRVEVYRPLQVDPKAARRARFKRQGARTTGLFAGLRDGAKAGY